MGRKKIGFSWGFCEDPDCPNYGERLVDRGHGSPVCYSVPVRRPWIPLRVSYRRWPGKTEELDPDVLKRRRERNWGMELD